VFIISGECFIKLNEISGGWMFYASFYCFKTDFSITYTFVFIYFFVGQNVNMYLCNTVWRHKMTLNTILVFVPNYIWVLQRAWVTGKRRKVYNI